MNVLFFNFSMWSKVMIPVGETKMSISDMTVSTWTPSKSRLQGAEGVTSYEHHHHEERKRNPCHIRTIMWIMTLQSAGTITPCLTFFNNFMWSKAKMLKCEQRRRGLDTFKVHAEGVTFGKQHTSTRRQSIHSATSTNFWSGRETCPDFWRAPKLFTPTDGSSSRAANRKFVSA